MDLGLASHESATPWFFNPVFVMYGCVTGIFFCSEELQKRNEVIRVLTKRVWVVETREEEVHKELSVARQQLSEFDQKQQHISQKFEDFEVLL